MNFLTALRAYAASTSGPLTCYDYAIWRVEQHEREYQRRAARDPASNSIPHLSAAYREIGGWTAALRAANLEHRAPKGHRLYSDEELLEPLRRCAAEPNSAGKLKASFSSHEYRAWQSKQEDWTPSVSGLRRRFGNWRNVQIAAGNLSSEEKGVHRSEALPEEEVLAILREAANYYVSDLTPRRYETLREELGHHDDWPSAAWVATRFLVWELALERAGIAAGGRMHPHEFWTAEECREVIARVKRLLKEASLDCTRWETLRAKSTKPLPSWQCVSDLCPERLGA